MARDQDPARACVQARTAQGSLNRRPDISHCASLARECAARIAVHSRKLDGRFIKEALEAVRLPEFPSARIGGVDSKLWRHQYRVHTGGRNLRRHLLAVAYVLGEIGAVAVKKHNHDRGAVTTSRCPRALARRTQKPFSAF
jgi:hypothetical protein